jgi:hypothetical protein
MVEALPPGGYTPIPSVVDFARAHRTPVPARARCPGHQGQPPRCARDFPCYHEEDPAQPENPARWTHDRRSRHIAQTRAKGMPCAASQPGARRRPPKLTALRRFPGPLPGVVPAGTPGRAGKHPRPLSAPSRLARPRGARARWHSRSLRSRRRERTSVPGHRRCTAPLARRAGPPAAPRRRLILDPARRPGGRRRRGSAGRYAPMSGPWRPTPGRPRPAPGAAAGC